MYIIMYTPVWIFSFGTRNKFTQNTIYLRNPSWPATIDICWQAAGRWTYPQWLQHPEGINSSPCAATERRSKEKEEEELYHPQEDQAQEEEGKSHV